MLFKWEWDRNR